MVLYIQNKTGIQLFIIYPEETPDNGGNLELYLQLIKSDPAENFGIKELKLAPWCATFELADVSVDELQVNLRPSGNFKIDWSCNKMPAAFPESLLITIKTIISISRNN